MLPTTHFNHIDIDNIALAIGEGDALFEVNPTAGQGIARQIFNGPQLVAVTANLIKIGVTVKDALIIGDVDLKIISGRIPSGRKLDDIARSNRYGAR